MVTEYLSCAETAKLVRVALKKEFPGVKFSVKSSTYSGGASISIGWLLGPTTKEVDAVAGGFEGASFDGMNDLKSYQESWVLPDGSAQLASRPDSYEGSVPGFVSDAPHAAAKLVKFGAYVGSFIEIAQGKFIALFNLHIPSNKLKLVGGIKIARNSQKRKRINFSIISILHTRVIRFY